MGRRVFERRIWCPLHNRENQARVHDKRFPPQYDGVSERHIAIIEAAGLAARIQAASEYPDEVFTRGESFWSLDLSHIELHGNFN